MSVVVSLINNICVLGMYFLLAFTPSRSPGLSRILLFVWSLLSVILRWQRQSQRQLTNNIARAVVMEYAGFFPLAPLPVHRHWRCLLYYWIWSWQPIKFNKEWWICVVEWPNTKANDSFWWIFRFFFCFCFVLAIKRVEHCSYAALWLCNESALWRAMREQAMASETPRECRNCGIFGLVSRWRIVYRCCGAANNRKENIQLFAALRPKFWWETHKHMLCYESVGAGWWIPIKWHKIMSLVRTAVVWCAFFPARRASTQSRSIPLLGFCVFACNDENTFCPLFMSSGQP